jgi:hypothetical protein
MLRRIQQLDLCDVEALLEILASASDLASAESLNERRRKLLSALARIVDADMWFWSITQHERSYEAKG